MEYIKKEDFHMKRSRKKEKNEIRTRTVIERGRERENRGDPCARTLSSGEIVKNHLYT